MPERGEQSFQEKENSQKELPFESLDQLFRALKFDPIKVGSILTFILRAMDFFLYHILCITNISHTSKHTHIYIHTYKYTNIFLLYRVVERIK